MIEVWLRQRLLAAPAVAAIVGTNVYPLVLPQKKTPPAVLYGRAGTDRQQHMAGSDGVVTAALNVACMSDDYDQAKLLADEVRLAIVDHQGTLPDYKIRRVSVSDDSDDYVPPVNSSDQDRFFVTMAVEIVYIERVPTRRLNA